MLKKSPKNDNRIRIAKYSKFQKNPINNSINSNENSQNKIIISKKIINIEPTKQKIPQSISENLIQSKEKNENKKENSEKKIIQKLTIIFTFRNIDCDISINPEITISKLKHKIANIIKLDSDKFVLIYNDTEISISNYTKTCKEFFNYPKINSRPILIIKKKQRSSVGSDSTVNSQKYNNKVKIINFPTSNKELAKIIEEFFKQNSLSSDYVCDHSIDDDILFGKDIIKKVNNNELNSYTIRFSSPNLAFDFNRYLCSLKLTNEKYKDIKTNIILAKKRSINKIDSSKNINILKSEKTIEKNYSDLNKKMNSGKYIDYFNNDQINKNISSNIENIENNNNENEINIKSIEINKKEQIINEQKNENINTNKEIEQKNDYNSISKKESRKIIVKKNEDEIKSYKYQKNYILKTNNVRRSLKQQNYNVKKVNKKMSRIKSMPDIEEQKSRQNNKEPEFMDTFLKLKKEGGEMNFNFVNFSGLNISTYKNDKRWVGSDGAVDLKNIPFIWKRYYYYNK